MDLVEFSSLLKSELSPFEYIRAMILIEKIISADSFENLNDDELHLLAKILKVNKTKKKESDKN